MKERIMTDSELERRANITYDFVNSFSEYRSLNLTYGGEEAFSMTEMHMLMYLDGAPGITATELAVGYRKSKGLISRMVNMFESRGYLFRAPDPSDSKKQLLFLTAKGKKLCISHEQYDKEHRLANYRGLLQELSEEEIDTFYHVMEVYTKRIKTVWLPMGKPRE